MGVWQLGNWPAGASTSPVAQLLAPLPLSCELEQVRALA